MWRAAVALVGYPGVQDGERVVLCPSQLEAVTGKDEDDVQLALTQLLPCVAGDEDCWQAMAAGEWLLGFCSFGC